MLKDITTVKVIKGYQLLLTFEDGLEGEVDISELIEFTGVFESFLRYEYFCQVFVNDETGTVEWPGGEDLDPLVLLESLMPSGQEKSKGVEGIGET
jgi:hypothetical protein